jgi:SAM-dependent methyltransferase
MALGVLHHVPDTAAAIRSCAELLKPGAPLLLYLYYATGNRPRWFRWLWHLSNAARLLIRRLPPRPKQLVTDLIALAVYWPLSRLASLASAPPWSSASLVPRSARCARPPGWWICAFRRGRPIGVSWGQRGRA